jgi:predicted DNA-binding transcriptional regulator AlpA
VYNLIWLQSIAHCNFASNEITFGMRDLNITRQILTPNEVCKLFGITRQTEWRWRKQGRLPKPIKINSKVMYRRKEIEKLLKY